MVDSSAFLALLCSVTFFQYRALICSHSACVIWAGWTKMCNRMAVPI